MSPNIQAKKVRTSELLTRGITNMKEYRYSYYLHDMFHTGLINGENEAECIIKLIKHLPHPEIMHEFKIQRSFKEWP